MPYESYQSLDVLSYSARSPMNRYAQPSDLLLCKRLRLKGGKLKGRRNVSGDSVALRGFSDLCCG
jgi:hypothetical protein